MLLLLELAEHLLAVDLSQVALDGLLGGKSRHSAQLGYIQLLEDSTADNGIGVHCLCNVDIYFVNIDRLVVDDILTDIHFKLLCLGVDLDGYPFLAVRIGSSCRLEHSRLYLIDEKLGLNAVFLSKSLERLEKVLIHVHVCKFLQYIIFCFFTFQKSR